jgi:hypothetical protein
VARFGVTGTPQFFIGRLDGATIHFGRRFAGAPTLAGLEAEIERAGTGAKWPWSWLRGVV